ncbi:MAG TPA: Fic family protein [Candidatus Paceibacterota bacterium]|nr:Fic family protein [Candidatus Paceibacterota bacterium]
MDDRELEFLKRFVVESDAIEGLANDPAVLRMQFADERCPGHAGAIRIVRAWADSAFPVDEPLIKLVQERITEQQHFQSERELPKELRGRYRPFNLNFGVDHALVPAAMRGLVREMATWQATQRDQLPVEKIMRIARFHWRYERIHPFADGNGRSGRALAYYLYRYAGLPPFEFTHLDRHRTYYPCFRSGSSRLMERYFLGRTKLAATP